MSIEHTTICTKTTDFYTAEITFHPHQHTDRIPIDIHINGNEICSRKSNHKTKLLAVALLLGPDTYLSRFPAEQRTPTNPADTEQTILESVADADIPFHMSYIFSTLNITRNRRFVNTTLQTASIPLELQRLKGTVGHNKAERVLAIGLTSSVTERP